MHIMSNTPVAHRSPPWRIVSRQRPKEIADPLKAPLIIVSAFALFVLLNPAVSDALSCAMPTPPTSFFSVCENNSCREGFAVQYYPARDCDARPAVVESSEIAESFSFVSRKLNIGWLNGIYELKTSHCGPFERTSSPDLHRRCGCLNNWSNEYCPKVTSIEKISDSTTLAQLNTLKSEWQQKEQEELRAVTTQKWSVVAIIAAVVALAILWPWILVGIWSNLRRRLSIFLIVAILLQAPLTLILYGIPFISSDNLVRLTAAISLIVLGLSILGEIIFLIARKINSREVVA